MSELDERHMQSWLDRELARSKDVIAERAAKCAVGLPETKYAVAIPCRLPLGHDGPHEGTNGWQWLGPENTFPISIKSDELRSIGSFSVLSEPDRQTIQEARRWLRYIWQQGFDPKLDALEHDGLHESMAKLDDLFARTAPEPSLSRVRTCVYCRNGNHAVPGVGECDCACH